VNFHKGQRVIVTLLGCEQPGRVNYQRMKPPSYSEPEAVSVILDSFAWKPNYNGHIFQVEDVRPDNPISAHTGAASS
jgi:hypothetical protein